MAPGKSCILFSSDFGSIAPRKIGWPRHFAGFPFHGSVALRFLFLLKTCGQTTDPFATGFTSVSSQNVPLDGAHLLGILRPLGSGFSDFRPEERAWIGTSSLCCGELRVPHGKRRWLSDQAKRISRPTGKVVLPTKHTCRPQGLLMLYDRPARCVIRRCIRLSGIGSCQV